MRLKSDDENMQYTWHVQDPKIQGLFEKQLSKHSVGAYVTLADEVGRSFWAIHRHSANEVRRPFPGLDYRIIGSYHSLEPPMPASKISA